MLAIDSIEINGSSEVCKSVNLIIGSNNSGKSTLLRELSSSVRSLSLEDGQLWLTGIKLRIDSPKDSVQRMFPRTDFANPGDMRQYNGNNFEQRTGFKLFRPNVMQSLREYFNQGLASSFNDLPDDSSILFDVNSSSGSSLVSRPHYSFFHLMSATDTIEEFCDSRLQAQLFANVQNIVSQRSESIVHHLLSDTDQLKLIQENIRTVFALEIGFDDLEQGDKPLRIMPSARIRRTQDRRQDAEEWQRLSPLLQTQGDGIKAYLKLIFSLLDDASSLIFIDEPEAFLHPPQRRQLGSLVAKLAREKNKQVFISTHDSEFLRGALSATQDIKVFNVKQANQLHAAQSVEISDFRNLTNNQPEILNERILNSFFYGKTIITESETDRVFYEYISSYYHWDIFQNKNFIGLSGIDKALNLFEKLRELELNVAVIVDIDFLSNKRYPQHLNDDELRDMHNSFKQKFNNAYDVRRLKKQGIEYLNTIDVDLRIELEALLNKYAEYGLFIPEVGELESWSGSDKNDLEQMLGYATSRRKRKLAAFLKRVLS